MISECLLLSWYHGIVWTLHWWLELGCQFQPMSNEKSCCTTSDQPNDRISRYMFRYLDLAYFCWLNCMLNAKISHFKIQPFFVFIGNFRCKYFWIKYSNILFSGLYFWSFRVSLLPQQASSLWQFCENKVKWKKVLEDNFSKKFNDFMIKSSSLPLENNIKSSEPSCSLGF